LLGATLLLSLGLVGLGRLGGRRAGRSDEHGKGADDYE
jgi:hypothetical protein